MIAFLLWIASLFLPTSLLQLLRKLASFWGNPGPDMDAFVDMAAAALRSKNDFICDLSARLERAEAEASDHSQAHAGLQLEVARLGEVLMARDAGLEAQKEAIAEARRAAQLAEQNEASLKQCLSVMQAEKEELADMLSQRETSYYTLLTTIEEYMSLVDINPTPSAEASLAEASAAANPTPEKLAFWTSRLESAAQLRRDSIAEPSATPPRVAVASSDESGDEKWHSPGIASRAKGLGFESGPAAASKQEGEPGADVESPHTLIRAIHDCMDSLARPDWVGEGGPPS